MSLIASQTKYKLISNNYKRYTAITVNIKFIYYFNLQYIYYKQRFKIH